MRTSSTFSLQFGITEVRHALKTKNKRTAQKLAIFIYNRLDIIFAKFIQKGVDVPVSSKIKQIINTYIREAIIEYSKLETMRHNTLRFIDENGKMYGGHTSPAIDREIGIIQDYLTEYDPQKLQEKAETILPRTNIAQEEINSLDNDEREIFYSELLKGESEILHYDKKRNEERVTGGSLLKNEEQKTAKETLAAAFRQFNEDNFERVIISSKVVNLFSELSQTYLENESVSRDWREKTYNKIVHVLKMAVEIMGDKSVEQYTRQDFEYFRTILQKLPASVSKKKEFEGKTLIEATEANATLEKKYPTLKVLSINTLIGQLHTFIEWCITHGYVQTNLCRNLKMRDNRKKIAIKDTFSDTNLLEIKTNIYGKIQKLYAKQPERVWVPIIGFYQGMRLEEIAQLHLEDVYQTKLGTWVFDLNENPNKNGEFVKHIKNNPSVRVVPIHPKLIEYGFLGYCEAVKKAGHERVFYNLKLGRDGFGRGVGDWFNIQTKRHISKSEKKSFHSARHTFIQLLKNISVDEHKVSALSGHGEEKMGYDRYGHEFFPEVLLPELIKIEYPQFEELLSELNLLGLSKEIE